MRFDKQFVDCPIGSSAETYPILQNLQSMAFFDFMFDEDMFKLLANQTLLYVWPDKMIQISPLVSLMFVSFVVFSFCQDITHFQKNATTGQTKWTWV